MAINSLSLNFSNPNIPKRQAGYTLIELSISLAIIAVLLVGTLTGVQRLLRSNNTNNTVSQTQAALTNITKLYASTGDATITTTNTLRDLGVWEAAAVKVVGGLRTPQNPFGGNIVVGANAALVGTAAAGSGYWYRLQGIPEEACASLATSFQNTATGIYVLNAPSTTTATIGATPAAIKGFKKPGTPLNAPGDLATACTANAATGAPLEIALFVANN